MSLLILVISLGSSVCNKNVFYMLKLLHRNRSRLNEHSMSKFLPDFFPTTLDVFITNSDIIIENFNDIVLYVVLYTSSSYDCNVQFNRSAGSYSLTDCGNSMMVTTML